MASYWHGYRRRQAGPEDHRHNDHHRLAGGQCDLRPGSTPVTQMITVEAAGNQAQAITFTLPMGTGTVGDKIAPHRHGRLRSGSDLSPVLMGRWPAIGARVRMRASSSCWTIGTTIITASQAGNATYAPATPVTQMITVEAAGVTPQVITFTPLAATTGTVGDVVLLSASTDAVGLFVRYAITPATGVATLTDDGTGMGSLTLVGEGMVTITASQAGSATYAPAADVTQAITVSKQIQTLTFMLAGTGTAGDKIALTATATSGLEVTFTSSDEAVAAIGTGADAGMLVLKTAGTATITASQAGNATYAAAPTVSQTITVVAASRQSSADHHAFTLAETTGMVGNRDRPYRP